MFSREESKQVRQQFWIFFGKRYPKKWLLYRTGIKDVALKFDFTAQEALVAIECTSLDEIDRYYYYDKLENLKNILRKEVSEEIQFEPNHVLASTKEISRVYLVKQKVNIHRKTDWPEVFDFFYEYMGKMEVFFLTYKDFIKN